MNNQQLAKNPSADWQSADNKSAIDFSRFECPDDIKEAYLGTKEALMRHWHRPASQKQRAIEFMLACIKLGFVKDPGNKTSTWLNSMRT